MAPWSQTGSHTKSFRGNTWHLRLFSQGYRLHLYGLRDLKKPGEGLAGPQDGSSFLETFSLCGAGGAAFVLLPNIGAGPV